MEQKSEIPTTSYFLLTATLLATIINIFLIHLARKITRKSPDIKYVLTLAMIDLFALFVIICDFLFLVISGQTVPSNVYSCQVYGGLLMIYYFVVGIAACALSFQRLVYITKKATPKYLWILPATLITAIIVVVIASGINLEMKQASDRLHCQVFPSISLLSAFTFYLILFVMFATTLSIIYCYSYIASFTINTNLIVERQEAMSLDPYNERIEQGSKSNLMTKSIPIRSKYIRGSSLRLLSIVAIYTLFMLPADILYLVQGLMYGTSYSDEMKELVANLASILYFLGICMNPVIVLFLHTGIFHEMKVFFNMAKNTDINNYQ